MSFVCRDEPRSVRRDESGIVCQDEARIVRRDEEGPLRAAEASGFRRVRGLWCARLAVQDGRSYLAHSRQCAPLKVAKPFAQEDGGLSICVMDCSPGLLNGDRQEIDCFLEPHAKLCLHMQAALKLHPSRVADGVSEQLSRFHVAQGALLEFLAEPVIPFAGARFHGRTIVEMEAGGAAVFSEIITPGRLARGECFDYQEVHTHFSVYWDGELALWDSLRLQPATWKDAVHPLGEYTHIGTLLVLSEAVAERHVEWLHAHLSACGPGVYGGASLVERGLAVRVLGVAAWELQQCLAECWRWMKRETGCG